MTWFPLRRLDPTQQVERAQRARRAWVLLTSLLAFGSLPGDRFPLPWLAAFILPAALLDLLQRRKWLRPPDRLAIAFAFQVLTIYGTARLAGPLDELAALGCTLLPGLAWFTIRNEPLDALRALFLAFCVFLIGTILGDPPEWWVVGFLGTLVLALTADSTAGAWEERASWRGPPIRGLLRWRTPLGLAGAAIVLCLGLFQLFQVVPSVGRGPELSGISGRGDDPAASGTRVGLDDEFDLASTGGTLISLQADKLVRAYDPTARAVPTQLYLRATHFDVPGLERWTTSARRRLRGAPDEVWGLQTWVEGLPTRSVTIEHLAPTDDFVFVPPGTYRIQPATGLVGDPASATFRFATPPRIGHTYRLDYQSVHVSPNDEPTDTRFGTGLLDLPADIEQLDPYLVELLSGRRVAEAITPLEVARAIADRLQERCTYDLRGPEGPHEQTLANFLDGNRQGFCMHFASVTALALRRYGVPARIGVGLYGGDRDPEDRNARMFGSHHAHAWVELPLRNIGWVVFDPTPPAARSGQLWPGPESDDEQSESEADDEAEAGLDPLDLLTDPLRYGWLWATLALIVFAALQLRGGRDKTATTSALRRHANVARSAQRSLEALLTELDRGFQHRLLPGESLERFGARLPASAPALRSSVADAFLAYQEVRFGAARFDKQREERMQRARRAVREAGDRKRAEPAD